jgi:hypothetical protein
LIESLISPSKLDRPVVPRGPATERNTVMPRIIVMSESSSEHEGAITLDERVASADMRSGHHSAQLIERVGWAVHDADDAEQREAPGRPPAN